ncbi:MAG TPA: DUF1579 domain-containing protein [Gemmataceae bacterium]|jgi:hypothetical protein|nr:DUF1579 domain-containing protein [Gemmataceae bacterium]
MKTLRWFCAVAMSAALVVSSARAQEPPKPGPEHEQLKKLEGAWEATMKIMGMESKGTMTYKMDVGGLWLTSNYEGEFLGGKFHGKGFDSYDTAKKKYVGIWVDSMSTSPLLMEGTFDKDKKEMTMTGEGPGPTGPTKMKAVTKFVDDNNIVFEMYMGDGKEPQFTITYKRKK